MLETGNCELRSVYTTLASNQGAFFKAREGRDHILVRATRRKNWDRKDQIFWMATSVGIRIKRIQIIARRTLNGCVKHLPRGRAKKIAGLLCNSSYAPKQRLTRVTGTDTWDGSGGSGC